MTDSAVLRWLPAIAAVVTVSMAAGAGQWQLGAMAAEMDSQAESIEENDDAIREIQQQLIRRQGKVELDLRTIQLEQQSQGKTVEEILRLIQQMRSE